MERVLCFTGPLGRDLLRRDAAALAQQAGGRVLPNPSGKTDIVVVGDTAPNWTAGDDGGVKILETIALQEQGHPIKMITGKHFRALVGVQLPAGRR